MFAYLYVMAEKKLVNFLTGKELANFEITFIEHIRTICCLAGL